jgi:hypothetical protein
MKGLVILSIISLFLVGFIGAIGITGGAVDNSTDDEELNQVSTTNSNEGNDDSEDDLNDDAEDDLNEDTEDEKVCCSILIIVPDSKPRYEIKDKKECTNVNENGEERVGASLQIVNNSFCKQARERLKEQLKERLKAKLSEIEKRELIQEKNRLKFEARTGVECPESCTCTGSVMKCTLANGREMTIMAGNSGNTIVQVKGENMTTKVVLYKAEDGKVYGVFKNNETKQVRMLPDQVREKIKEKLARQLEKEDVTLTEDGTYQYDGEKKKKLFMFIPVNAMVRAEIDPETGEVLEISKPKWWEFLATDEGNQIVGASCGTVSPDSRETCCKGKGYDTWDNTIGDCVFSN